jgi:hypothetical protein
LRQYLWDYLEKNIVIQGQTTIHEVSSPGKKANKTTPPLPLGAFCHITEHKYVTHLYFFGKNTIVKYSQEFHPSRIFITISFNY